MWHSGIVVFIYLRRNHNNTSLARWLVIKKLPRDPKFMNFIEKHTTIPVLPVPYVFGAAISLFRNAASTRRSVWLSLTIEAKSSIVSQRAGFVSQLPAMKTPNCSSICSILGCPVYDMRLLQVPLLARSETSSTRITNSAIFIHERCTPELMSGPHHFTRPVFQTLNSTCIAFT